MELSKEDQEKLYNVGVDMGISFQIRDDVQDFIGDEKKTGKTQCADISSNIITAPILVGIKSDSDSRLMEIVKSRRMHKHKRYILKKLEEKQCIEISSLASLEYNLRCLHNLKEMGICSPYLYSHIIKSTIRDH